MKLTAHQQAMLDGRHGKGTAMAMEILVGVGECFGAERMLPVSRVHISLSAQDADIWFAKKMLEAGAFCTVPPTVNPGYSLRCFGETATDGGENMRQADRAYRALGAVLSYSCTPYLFDNIPRFGEITAFSETSATIYANAVLGARTNREGANSALCAAITGYVPEYGMLLRENRLGTVLVEVQAEMTSDYHYSLLGLLAKKMGRGVPVFAGLGIDIRTEALIALGTQLNVSGSYSMFHIPGVTPEAPDLQSAFGGTEPQQHVVITEQNLREAQQIRALPGPLEFVMLGCPHYTYRQLAELAELLGGKRAAVPVYVLTSAAVRALAADMGLLAALENARCEVIESTCVDQPACWSHLRGKCGLTDSPKCAYYTATFGLDMQVRDIASCVAAALEGRDRHDKAVLLP